ncbi:MAG TPA: RNA polymerase sigma factor [Azospirillaceae bacterium]|nr:RNA polymerase sigma factor [Azospirillaceae bacterium]
MVDPDMAASAHGTREEALAAASDEALVARVAAGDRAAYAELVSRHLDRTVTVARRLLGSRAEAEDVAQEAFLRLWLNAGRFRPEAARFTTWFYRITMNLCLDRKRRPDGAPLEAAGDPADPAPGAEEALDRSQTARAVALAVEELPERQRAAISLCYDAGLSNAEAARAMEVSVGALETLLVRARRALRDRLSALMPDGATRIARGGPR